MLLNLTPELFRTFLTTHTFPNNKAGQVQEGRFCPVAVCLNNLTPEQRQTLQLPEYASVDVYERYTQLYSAGDPKTVIATFEHPDWLTRVILTIDERYHHRSTERIAGFVTADEVVAIIDRYGVFIA